MEKIGKKDIKITLVKLKFSAKNFNELEDNKNLSLSETAQNLFHFIEYFARYEGQINVNMWMGEEPIQKIETDTSTTICFFPKRVVRYIRTKN